MHADLSIYNNSWYKPGSFIKRILWHYTNIVFFNSGWFPFYGIKVFILKLFGAKMGKGILIKPYVNIKYPWYLTIGNYVWIGEHVWIDNLAEVTLGDNVCISQGALLLTGSHNYKMPSFDLIVRPITLKDSVWICAKAILCSGVICHANSIVTAGSIITSDCDENGIYRGNPGIKIKNRSD